MAISHNPADYSRFVHLVVRYAARVKYQGNLQAAWEEYFRTREEVARTRRSRPRARVSPPPLEQ